MTTYCHQPTSSIALNDHQKYLVRAERNAYADMDLSRWDHFQPNYPHLNRMPPPHNLDELQQCRRPNIRRLVFRCLNGRDPYQSPA